VIERGLASALPFRGAPVQTADTLSDRYAMKTTWRGYALYGIASVFAIILGVIPALWINRWRHDTPVAQHEQPAHAGVTVEPIAMPGPTIEAIAPVVSVTTAPEPAESSPLTTKRHGKAERVKRPQQKQPKRSPPCDVYLHPHGCPR
jgi:hypothetical protein